MTGSVLFHVQYLLGIGHLQRTLRIAEALAEDGIDVTLVSGGMPAALPIRRLIRLVQLPPVRVRDARFELTDADGAPLEDALRQRRRAALLAAFAGSRPDVVVIEGFPFARRAFRFELEPLIAAVREARPRPSLLCSVRDIITMRADPQRRREAVERVRRDFDAVLVHGDPALVPFEASFPAAAEIADRLVYTGYVAPPPLPPSSTAAGGDGVVVSAGGGAAGHALLRTALAARRAGCLAELSWLLLAGTNLPEAEFAALCRAAPSGVAVERFVPDLAALLRRCRVSVSQAGYNTVLDILSAHARAVLVPFAAERETEQLLRAERLAALGAVELVRESELSPATLAAAIERAASRDPVPVRVAAGGAARSARIIAETIGARVAAEPFAAATGTGMMAR
jgi:predicted glycosyltransferase